MAVLNVTMARSKSLIIAFAIALILSSISEAFRTENSWRFHPQTKVSYISMYNKRPEQATLDGNTLWRLSLKLEKPGFKSIEAVARVRFIEDRNYEPPQGKLFIEDDLFGLIKVNEKGFSGNWMLSEDKEDRKDGLWVWGLFEEPKYPFLYFSLGVFDSIVLPSGAEEPIFGGEGVPNDRLDFRFSHVRDQEKGVILSDGIVTYKLTELVKADPLGIGGKVNVGESVVAGRVNIRPILEQKNEEDEEDSALIQQINEGMKQNDAPQ
jgi:hypothetical protein